MTVSSSDRKILIVEDDPDIAQLLAIHFKELGYVVDQCFDGVSGLKKGLSGEYALILLDLMLPKLDGYEVCKKLRAQDSRVPVIILTLKSEVIDKVLGLELGADDYITKPFSVQEVVARAKALMRRAQGSSKSLGGLSDLRIGGLLISPLKRKVTALEKEVALTRKQFDLLYFLACSPGRAFDRGELLDRIWGYDVSGYDHTVDTHVNRLRAKIEPDPSRPRYILTVWGVGYRFAEPQELE